jgi:demethylmenaquinone methyltransferase/2-methoxy-6-polyprenyl-1,4-benzoquinol methylase
MHHKKLFIRRMYDTLAARYDLANQAISLGQDRLWRQQVVRRMPRQGFIADLGAGTGALTAEYGGDKRAVGHVVLVDFNRTMLSRARSRLTEMYPHLQVSYVIADVEHLPFSDETFAGCMSAFVLRNLPTVSGIAAEAQRILAPGGIASFLDATRPSGGVWQKLYDLYFQRVMPALSHALNPGESEAYQYLAGSVVEFPSPADVLHTFRQAGFTRPRLTFMWRGILTIFMARKVSSIGGNR